MPGKSFTRWLFRIGDLFAFAAGLAVVILVLMTVVADMFSANQFSALKMFPAFCWRLWLPVPLPMEQNAEPMCMSM